MDDGTRQALRVILDFARSWRNWQTHQLEGLAVAIPWWFESTRPHHLLFSIGSNPQIQVPLTPLVILSVRHDFRTRWE